MNPMATYSRRRTPALLLLSVFTTSCGGQGNAPVTEAGIGEPQPAPASQGRLTKTQGTTPYDNVHCGLRDKAGNLWFGTTGEGVYGYDGKGFTNLTVNNGLSSNRVWTMLEDRAGNIWFGTDGGACRYDGKTFTRFPIPEPSGRKTGVSSIFQDKAGGMWFGTGGSGVYRYDGKVVTRLLSDAVIVNPKMLKLNDVQQMLEDKTGAIWFASWTNEGVCRYDGRTLTNVTSREGLRDGMVHSLLQDKAGGVWIGTREHGLCRYDGKSFKHVTGVEGLSNACVYSMLEDKAGSLWFATEKNGVWRFDGDSFTNLTTKDGLGNDSVFCIVEDDAGRIWFGTRNVGLCRYDGKSFTEFSGSGSQP